MGNIGHAFRRLFFRLLYNEFAWSYDLVSWLVSLGKWNAWGRTTLSHLRGERVLELGHGPGHLLATLRARGFAAVGVDLSPAMARQAKRRLRRIGPTVPLVRGRAQALPFSGANFDNVVAAFPTEFIVDPRTLQEVTRILTPQGQLTVAAAVRFEGAGPMASLLRWLYRVTGQSQPFPEAFMPLLEEAGFTPRVIWEDVNQTVVMLVVAEKDQQHVAV